MRRFRDDERRILCLWRDTLGLPALGKTRGRRSVQRHRAPRPDRRFGVTDFVHRPGYLGRRDSEGRPGQRSQYAVCDAGSDRPWYWHRARDRGCQWQRDLRARATGGLGRDQSFRGSARGGLESARIDLRLSRRPLALQSRPIGSPARGEGSVEILRREFASAFRRSAARRATGQARRCPQAQ